MSLRRRSILAPAAIVLALSLTPMLTACGGNPIQGLVNSATGGLMDVGGKSVPKDFPSEVPLAPGEVLSGMGFGSEDGKVWNVGVKVSGTSAIEGIASQLEGAGFVMLGDKSVTMEEGAGNIFTKEPYGVLVIVAKDDKGSFVANYTVTYSKDGS